MKYFIDTEFLEGTQDKTIFGIKYSKTKPTIDLISIALVSEDGREYYAISKDFNLKEAWNRYDIKVETMSGDDRNIYSEGRKYKECWIRDNVLMSIFIELKEKETYDENNSEFKPFFDKDLIKEMIIKLWELNTDKENYKEIKRLINKYGKSNKQIAEEILEFVYNFAVTGYPKENTDKIVPKDIEFYGYYSDYDWVVFCWLFGYMKDLPKGFPMYCIDLKQELNTIEQFQKEKQIFFLPLKEYEKYPKQINEHNALADAKWNFELYKFLEQL